MIIAYKARTNRVLSERYYVIAARCLISRLAISSGNVVYTSPRNRASILVLP